MKRNHLQILSCSAPVPRRGFGGRTSLLFIALACGSLLAGCGKPNTKAPGIESMGSPGIAWADKSEGMRMGFMAAFVHPRSEQLFVEFDDSYADGFTCETCHGEDAELNDYEMPSDAIYALPRENALEESMEYDADTTVFMRDKLTASFNKWLNQGEGPRTDVTCFSCHPVDE